MKRFFIKKRFIILMAASFLSFGLLSPALSAKTHHFTEREIDDLYDEDSWAARKTIRGIVDCETQQEAMNQANMYSINMYYFGKIKLTSAPDHSYWRVTFMNSGAIYVYHYVEGNMKADCYFKDAFER